MAGKTEVIHLQRAAPAKPAPGDPCNGCGVCCAAETCPSTRLLYLRRKGPCPALAWKAEENRYRCGLLVDPAAHLRWLPRCLNETARRIVARGIAAGSGCDCWLEVVSPE